MFFRLKSVGPHTYVQLVENRRENGRSKQRVLLTLGALDKVREAGQLDSLLMSGSRLSTSVLLVSEHQRGLLHASPPRRFGSVLVFERLWRQSGCQDVLLKLGSHRRFGFSLNVPRSSPSCTGCWSAAPTVPPC